MRVHFIKQGGNEAEGEAVGRKGSQLLIQYRINDGSPRERWIPKSRIVRLDGDIDKLPKYRTRTCPAVKFPKPLTSDEMVEAGHFTIEPARHEGYLDRKVAVPCSKCGRRHGEDGKYDRSFLADGHRQFLYTGWKSLKLGEERVEA